MTYIISAKTSYGRSMSFFCRSVFCLNLSQSCGPVRCYSWIPQCKFTHFVLISTSMFISCFSPSLGITLSCLLCLDQLVSIHIITSPFKISNIAMERDNQFQNMNNNRKRLFLYGTMILACGKRCVKNVRLYFCLGLNGPCHFANLK